jgi:Domain of unknown function (DUF3536)/Glycosyl hydrolase family 57
MATRLRKATITRFCPLCNPHDRRTQVEWGIADFRYRFGRKPEALWLPETACNDATLETLIEAELVYAILSPHQALRVRQGRGGEWRDVSDGSIDPHVPYRYVHRDGSGRSIALFFYDGPLAQAIAFEGALASSDNLVERLAVAKGSGGNLVNVATDGESYGHHCHFADRCLAYALEVLAPQRGLAVTNYGDFLDRNPPAAEVEIKPGPGGEGTAWSCVHGLGRWYRDCGCSDGPEGWNQAWRGPLRAALDFLRDRAACCFLEIGGDLFRDPWAARDGYIELILNPHLSRTRFLNHYSPRRLSETHSVRALDLLEMQRAAMLMYTSCGWFFSELSGLETVQIMRYAARVLDYMEELDVPVPLDGFLGILAQAHSNRPELGHGADIYRRLVEPARARPQRIAAHLAITGLAGETAARGAIGDYSFSQADYSKRSDGRLTLGTSQLLLTAVATGRTYVYAAAAIHLGGLDFYCALKPNPGINSFKLAAAKLWERFETASLPALLRMIQTEFGPDEFGLDDILADGRWDICEMAFGYLSHDLTAELSRLYEQDQRIIEMLHRAGFDLPPELRIITEFTLGKRFEQEIRAQGRSLNPAAYTRAFVIAEEVTRHHYRIDKAGLNQVFSEMITGAVRRAVAQPRDEWTRPALESLRIARRLRLEPNLDSAQETVYEAIVEGRSGFEQLEELAGELELAPGVMARNRP